MVDMKIFEIHITGQPSIIKELDSLGIKSIIVELLWPDHSLLRTEYMSSFVEKFHTYEDCKVYVDALVLRLKSPIIRVKIESPYYEDYAQQSLYMESHFTPFNNVYPISRNKKSGKLMATDRTYIKSDYAWFLKKWKNEDVELCLFDSFVQEDRDWFNLYN